jgi:hypothetical protein
MEALPYLAIMHPANNKKETVFAASFLFIVIG